MRLLPKVRFLQPSPFTSRRCFSSCFNEPSLQNYSAPSWLPETSGYRPTHYVPLTQRPTPIQPFKLPPALFAADHFPFSKNAPDSPPPSVWVKRDDASGVLLSGNKVRKLEFVLGDALEQKCDGILTIGGVQSNHCRATAAAALLCGLKSHLILRVRDSKTALGLEGNLLINRMLGSKLHLVSGPTYKKQGQFALLDAVASSIENTGEGKVYKLPVGGSTKVGVFGYIEMMKELQMQTDEVSSLPTFTDIVVACGSGGTASGLAIGNYFGGYGSKVHAISVCDNAAYFYSHLAQCLTELGFSHEDPTLHPCPSPEDMLNIVDDYRGIGYGLTTASEISFMKTTGVITDQTYTAKALLGLVGLYKTNQLKGDKVLFIHTGGLYSQWGHLNDMQSSFREDEMMDTNVDLLFE